MKMYQIKFRETNGMVSYTNIIADTLGKALQEFLQEFPKCEPFSVKEC